MSDPGSLFDDVWDEVDPPDPRFGCLSLSLIVIAVVVVGVLIYHFVR